MKPFKEPAKQIIGCSLALLIVIIICCSHGVSAVSPTVMSDDWRYKALAELSAGGLLELSDALLYSSGAPVTLQQMCDSVERAVARLDQASSGGSIRIAKDYHGRVGVVISPRQASLIADLISEFGPKFRDPVVVRLGLQATSGAALQGLVLDLEPAPTRKLSSVEPLRISVAPSHAVPMKAGTSVSDLSQMYMQLSSGVKPAAPPADPQFQVGLPAPIGSVAVELSSQAAKRPAEQESSALPSDVKPAASSVFDLSTSVQLADILKVSAAFFTDDAPASKATATQVGVRIGEKEEAGIVVSQRVTEPSSDPARAVKETVTSVDVKYSLPDLTGKTPANDLLTVRAGYELYGRGDAMSSTVKGSLQSTTSLVIDYKLLLGDAAFLQAGYRYERMRDLIASGAIWTKSELYDGGEFGSWPEGEPLRLSGPDATRTVASIDFGYKLLGDTALLLGYKLIDFSDVGSSDVPKNLATAEVTIRF